MHPNRDAEDSKSLGMEKKEGRTERWTGEEKEQVDKKEDRQRLHNPEGEKAGWRQQPARKDGLKRGMNGEINRLMRSQRCSLFDSADLFKNSFWGGRGKIWTFSVSSLPFLSSFPNMVFPLYIFWVSSAEGGMCSLLVFFFLLVAYIHLDI